MRVNLHTPIILLIAWAAITVVNHASAGEFSPDSPEVKRMVARGIAYLQTKNDARLGGQCLVALCHLKNSGESDHPQVVAAVKSCEKACSDKETLLNYDIYSTGIALIFLCELDPQLHKSKVSMLVEALQIK